MARARLGKNKMRRTTIWLDPETRKAIDARSRKTGVSKAFVVRLALRRELGLPTEDLDDTEEEADAALFG